MIRSAASLAAVTVAAVLSLSPACVLAQQGSSQGTQTPPPSGSPGSQDDQILEQGSGTQTPPPVEQADEEELSTTYSSIGLQKVHAKFDNVKDAINLDIVMIGFRLPPAPWFGVELDASFTMMPGQVDTSSSSSSGGTCITPGFPPGCVPASTSSTTSSNDFTSTNLGAFAVLRSTGKFFVMGKYGYRYLDTSLPELQNDRSGDAYAAGIGYRWNRRGSYAEFGYTKYSDKIDAFGFSVSYSYGHRDY